VDITRGVVARIFGFSMVKVQTAGSVRPTAEGIILAIEIKDAIDLQKKLLKKASLK